MFSSLSTSLTSGQFHDIFLTAIIFLTFPGFPDKRSPNFFLHLAPAKKTLGDKWHLLFRVRCPSCHPTNSVKAPKETRSTDPNQERSSNGLNLSSNTTRLLTEGHVKTCATFPPKKIISQKWRKKTKG